MTKQSEIGELNNPYYFGYRIIEKTYQQANETYTLYYVQLLEKKNCFSKELVWRNTDSEMGELHWKTLKGAQEYIKGLYRPKLLEETVVEECSNGTRN